MHFVSKWAIGIGSIAFGAVALAADSSPAPQEKPAQKADGTASATPARRPRLTVPWSQLTDLSDDQKTKILDIIGKTNEQIVVIRAKERTEIMALLNDDQKKKAEEVESTRTRGRGRGAASRPAAAQN